MIFINPECSKCRTALGLLNAAGVDATEVRYLETPPTVEELQRLMELLGFSDPRNMTRTNEPVYAELGLDRASPSEVLEAIATHPILLERPIFVWEGRAVIGRPPERVLELLDPAS